MYWTQNGTSFTPLNYMGMTAPPTKPPQRPTPLAIQIRPFKLDEVIGQTHLVGVGQPIRKMAEKRRAQSTILWGPPGTGKTSLVRALSREVDATFYNVNATNATVKELREIIVAAEKESTPPLVFIDECLPWGAMVCVRIDGIPQLKPIGFLVENRVKCEIFSVNTQTDQAQWMSIISWSVVDSKPMVEIEIEGGYTLKCSEDHLIFTTNRGYIPAKLLGPDDDVCLLQSYLQETHEYAKTQKLLALW